MSANAARIQEILDGFPGRRILVLGDAMLDHYIWGEAGRISPEAPVPVVSVRRESWRLGGAANVAHNIRALGGEPRLVSVVGEDEAARALRPRAGAMRDRRRRRWWPTPIAPTVQKTRV